MKKVIYLFLMVVLSVSCFDDFLTEEPETLVTNNNFWQNEKDVESAVYGMHRWFRWVIGRVDVLEQFSLDLTFDCLHSCVAHRCTGTV